MHKQTGLSTRSLQRKARAGEIPGCKKNPKRGPGGGFLIEPCDELEEWVRLNTLSEDARGLPGRKDRDSYSASTKAGDFELDRHSKKFWDDTTYRTARFSEWVFKAVKKKIGSRGATQLEDLGKMKNALKLFVELSVELDKSIALRNRHVQDEMAYLAEKRAFDALPRKCRTIKLSSQCNKKSPCRQMKESVGSNSSQRCVSYNSYRLSVFFLSSCFRLPFVSRIVGETIGSIEYSVFSDDYALNVGKVQIPPPQPTFGAA